MKVLIAASLVALLTLPAVADQAGAPAAPSGSPKDAAEKGSSEAGKAGAKNEMSSHDENAAKQGSMANPHKQAQ